SRRARSGEACPHGNRDLGGVDVNPLGGGRTRPAHARRARGQTRAGGRRRRDGGTHCTRDRGQGRAGDLHREPPLRPRHRPRRPAARLRGELNRFDAWLASQDIAPTLVALRQRADEIVERVLEENDRRWEGMTEADRERLATAARAIASRLLHEPTLRLRRAATDPDAYIKVAALRELFGLDPGSEPLEAGGAEVSDLGERRHRNSGRGQS